MISHGARPSQPLRGPRLRAFGLQLSLASFVGLVLWYFAANAHENLQERQIASGFAFLFREAGFEISETTLLSYSAAQNYLRALVVGFLNTVRVAASGIVFATALGTFIGIARLSSNWLLAKLAAGYVEIIRNVPLLVQLFFWYALITESLPGPAQALNPLPGVFLSNRGVVFPVPAWHPIHSWMIAVTAAGAVAAALWIKRRRRCGDSWLQKFALTAALLSGPPLAMYFAAGAPGGLHYPVLGGFNFASGGAFSPEFLALLLGLVIYTSAFIAEIVRGGILSVDRGQLEAALSLGLGRRDALRFVIVPQSLRAIIPPITSQYLNCVKNSSLAVAIGYPDLVSIANTTMNQTGQAIEGIAIIMIVYLSISLAISALMNWYNRHVAVKGAAR